MFIYSIFDKKANVHRSFMACSDDATAMRSVARVANDGNSDLFTYCDDFALYNLGNVDINSGVITPVSPINFVCDVNSLIKRVKSVESN